MVFSVKDALTKIPVRIKHTSSSHIDYLIVTRGEKKEVVEPGESVEITIAEGETVTLTRGEG